MLNRVCDPSYYFIYYHVYASICFSPQTSLSGVLRLHQYISPLNTNYRTLWTLTMRYYDQQYYQEAHYTRYMHNRYNSLIYDEGSCSPWNSASCQFTSGFILSLYINVKLVANSTLFITMGLPKLGKKYALVLIDLTGQELILLISLVTQPRKIGHSQRLLPAW